HDEEDDRHARADPFVPSGEWKLHRRLAARRPHDRERQSAPRDALLTNRLRIRIDIGPAPMRRAIEPGFDQAIADELALHLRDFFVERVPIRRLAAPPQIRARLLLELALPKCVVAALLRLPNQIQAFRDLTIRIPQLTP